MARHPFLTIAALSVGSLLALSACSSQGGKETAETEAATGGSAVDTEEISISMVTHAAAGDTFWDIVRKGAEENAAKNNVDLQYTSDPDGSRQAQLVNQAVDQGVDGIIVTLAKPEAMEAAVSNAVEADIPVISINAGEDEFADMGILTHFGQNDKEAGKALAERLAEDDLSKPICVIQEQGHVGLENRCAGVKEVMPDSEILYVNGQDMASVKSTVSSSLQSADADVIIGLGAPYTMTIVDAVDESGSDITVASADLNEELAQAIKDGDVLATVDQQPYLQGYQAVDALWAYHRGGFVEGGGQQIFTGPAIVDADNVDDVLEYAKEGVR